jgi:hypothetical protein
VPRVQPVPQGNNISAVRGLSDRTRALEARRNAAGINTNGEQYINNSPSSFTYIQPTGWPVTTSVIGQSGEAWVMYGTGGGSFAEAAILVDGVFTNNADIFFGSNYNWWGVGITGLSPGSHEFALVVLGEVFSEEPFVDATDPCLIVWPL